MQGSLLRWVGLGGLVLVVAVVGWALTRGSYKGDIAKICNAETSSGVKVTQDQASVVKWIKEHLDTPEASSWFTEIGKKSLPDRSKALDDEAKRLGIGGCPLVASYEALNADGQYKSDLRLLCTMNGLAGIESLPDDQRLAKMQEWGEKQAKSPRTKDAVAKVAKAVPKDRGDVLRGIANDDAVYQCELANVLASPPTAPETAGGFIRLARAEVSGDLTEPQVFDAIKSSMEPFRKCYDTALAKNKALAGPMTFRVLVEPHGKVASARAMSGPKDDKEIAECMAKAIESVAFADTTSKITKVILHLDLVPSADAMARAAGADAGTK